MALPYMDELGFFHDTKKASSNNKFIFTAYAKKVGLVSHLTIDMIHEIRYCYWQRVRHSFRDSVPMSRDEIMGICYLYPYYAKKLIEDNFRMCKEMPKFHLIRFCKQLVEHIKNRKDRNYWHENNLEQMQFITMVLLPHDRATIYRIAQKRVPVIYWLIDWVDSKRKASGRSSAAIRCFKYEKVNFTPIGDYFEEGHPIKDQVKALNIPLQV